LKKQNVDIDKSIVVHLKLNMKLLLFSHLKTEVSSSSILTQNTKVKLRIGHVTP
jgi:hypothetical protein